MKFKMLSKPFNGLVESRNQIKRERFKKAMAGFKQSVQAMVGVEQPSLKRTVPLNAVINTAFQRRFMKSRFLSADILKPAAPLVKKRPILRLKAFQA
jgi:hypothetical protein